MNKIRERVYKYSRLQKGIYLGMFMLFTLMGIVMLSLLFLSVLSNPTVVRSEGIGPLLATLFISTFMPFMAMVINMVTPDIWVRDEGFRLTTPFYRSRWIGWDEIRSIEKVRRLLGTNYGIGIDGISSIYSLIGYLYGLGGRRAFMVGSRIDNFEELMERLEMHRPDLFADQG